MSSFVLKLIGIISMLCDHIGFAFYNPSFLRVIGRVAFPIFAFQAVIGYEHTKDVKKHLIKMIIFAFISQIPFSLLYITLKQPFTLNVMFTIILGLFSIILFNKINNRIICFIVLLLIGCLGSIIRVDYGIFGIVTIFLFYYFKNNKMKMFFYFSITFLIRYLLHIIFIDPIYYLLILLGTLTAFIPISLYNKKEGIKTKYLFYLFYPLHLLIIYLIYLFFQLFH
jgi:hypothetical protein